MIRPNTLAFLKHIRHCIEYGLARVLLFFFDYLAKERNYDENSVLFTMAPVVLILAFGMFAALIVFGVMAKFNETTALRCLGVSIFRIVTPVAVVHEPVVLPLRPPLPLLPPPGCWSARRSTARRACPPDHGSMAGIWPDPTGAGSGQPSSCSDRTNAPPHR